MEKFSFTRGSTLLISGEWRAGDPFRLSTTIGAVIKFQNRTTPEASPFVCTVTLMAPGRTFEIYASAEDTSTWPIGVHTISITRTDADYFANHDPFVEVLEPVQIEVR